MKTPLFAYGTPCLAITAVVVLVLTATVLAKDLETPVQKLGPKAGVPQGFRLIEGDILVTDSFPQGGFVPKAGFVEHGSAQWDDGIVPFVFDENVSSANRTKMRAAMDEWEAVANVRFVPHTNPLNQPNWLHVIDADHNSSFVGRLPIPGWQYVNIKHWNEKFIICHELAHALGFYHEQSRPDRNTYVRIEDENVESGKEHNFDLHSEADQYGPYDFDSVMHYAACLFSTCDDCAPDDSDCRTITVRSPWNAEWQGQIGQQDHLSHWDKLVMSFLYPRSNWRFVSAQATGIGVGTFRNPFSLLSLGIDTVPTDGTLWLLSHGDYHGPKIISKKMTLRAPLGGAVIRR